MKSDLINATVDPTSITRSVAIEQEPLGIHSRSFPFVVVVIAAIDSDYAIVVATAPWIFFLAPRLISTLHCSCNVILLIITAFMQDCYARDPLKLNVKLLHELSVDLEVLIWYWPNLFNACGLIRLYMLQPEIGKMPHPFDRGSVDI